MTPPRLSWFQKRLVRTALSFGAANANELARWSGLSVFTIYRIARGTGQAWPRRKGKRYKYHAACAACWKT